MEKKTAREMLEINNGELAEILCISGSHLSRMKELSKAQDKIVKGEMAKRILTDAVVTIERLEKEIGWVGEFFPEIAKAASEAVNHVGNGKAVINA